MISADEALSRVLEAVSPLPIERLMIHEAVGRVLAGEVLAPRDIPGFSNSAMDGFAVRATDLARATAEAPARLRIIETIAAGSTPTHRIEPGSAARIMTGAPIPEGADCVVPVEQTRFTDDMVEISVPLPAGNCIRLRGEDLRKGERVLEPGHRLRPAEIGVLASLNRSVIEVYGRPRVGIVSTGDEIVDIDEVPAGSQVVNSSAHALAAGVAELGAEASVLRVARDRVEEITERFSEACRFDLILSTGGVSVGQYDHVSRVLKDLGFQQSFHGVAQRPGKPLAFGILGGKPLFALPGNPVSTMVSFYLYVRPALLKMMGHREVGLPKIIARCAENIKTAAGLTEFIRVRIKRLNGALYATPTGAQGSGILSSMSRAHGLLIGPASETILKEGSQAAVLLLAPESAADLEARFEA